MTACLSFKPIYKPEIYSLNRNGPSSAPASPTPSHPFKASGPYFPFANILCC